MHKKEVKADDKSAAFGGRALNDGLGTIINKELDMEVTHEMLAAAMKKAVETGVMQKMADEETYLSNWASMRKILEAALAGA